MTVFGKWFWYVRVYKCLSICLPVVCMYVCRVSYRISCWGGGTSARVSAREIFCMATPTFTETTPTLTALVGQTCLLS